MSTSTSSPRAADRSREFSGLAADYANYDGLGLADLIAKKKISPLELLHAVRQRVDAFNPQLNALCHLFFDRAEAQINAGLGTGPFRGVPYALKDLGQYLAGTITSAGSRIWKDSVADFDSTLVERYKHAGLVTFGKTNSPELGLTTTTESVLFGQTHNPWNLERTSGGSSGGSAAMLPAEFYRWHTAAMAVVRSGFQRPVVASSVLSRPVGAYRWDRGNLKVGTAVRNITH